MARQCVGSGSPWEAAVGYSRAVRVNQQVYVAGTTASDASGRVIGPEDPYAQTVFILRKIEAALKEAGAGLQDVVRTRMYVTRIEDWTLIARAHREFFHDVLPAATMVEVTRLIDPAMRIEIEVDAVIPESGDSP